MTTEEEQPKPADSESTEPDESTDTDESTAQTDESTAAGTKDKGDQVADPKQTSWPPVG